MRSVVCGLLFALAALGQTQGIEEKAALAKQEMQAGRFDQAAALYRELVRALPGNAGMRMNLGLALHQAGKYREAIAAFRTALKQQPDLTAAWLMLGMAHLKVGQAAEAIAPLERYLKADPSNSGVRFELADACLEAGRPAVALREFTKLAEAQPSEPKPWQGVALSYIAMSQSAFRELEAAAPESGFRSMLLARSAFARGQMRSAMRLYREALARTPSLRGAHQELAEVYRNTAHPDWAEAEEQRERALGASDCNAHALECAFAAKEHKRVIALSRGFRTAEALYWRSRASSALADGALAKLSAMPASSTIYELLAEADRLRGDEDGAVRHWEEAVKLAPGDRRIEKGLARAMWVKRDSRAVPLLENLLRSEPDSVDLQFELGDALADEEAARAVSILERARKLAPGHLGIRAALGRAYVRLDKPVLAIPHLEAALALDTDGKLHYQLGRAYQAAGQAERARAMMQKYRELSQAARERQPAMDEDLKQPQDLEQPQN